MKYLLNLFSRTWDWLFPDRCVYCGAQNAENHCPAGHSGRVCDDCLGG